MKVDQLALILEGALLASEHPLNIKSLMKMFSESDKVNEQDMHSALQVLSSDCKKHSYELCETSDGYRIQVCADLAPYMSRLWPERSRSYSPQFLEVLALIAYKQPITRADIEAIRGVPLSAYIMRVLNERKWISAVGQADVPGKPTLYGTTPEFLDYFNLPTLDDLPPLPNETDTKDTE